MDSYKFTQRGVVVQRLSDGLFVPMAQDNMDCQRFLKDAEAGANVLNADGTPWVYGDAAVRALGLTSPA